MGFVTAILEIIIFLILLGIVLLFFTNIPEQFGIHVFSPITISNQGPPVLFTSTTSVPQPPESAALSYALTIINKNRSEYGLPNVSYVNVSGQQHADSMLRYGYFSHWDPAGMKPYMRYTLLGGTQSVQENVAYEYNSSGINVINALKQMEYNMMYNDAQCCNNGHRDNILTPQHNQVSIGVAYNKTTIYFVEDFINNYISWAGSAPSYNNNGDVVVAGAAQNGYSVQSVEVSYDSPVAPLSKSQLAATSEYSYGQTIAGIGYSNGLSTFYYPNITTVYASKYQVNGNNFDIEFNIRNLTKQYGAGEYTIMVSLTNATGPAQGQCTVTGIVKKCNTFLAATYTLFLNSSGARFTPSNV